MVKKKSEKVMFNTENFPAEVGQELSRVSSGRDVDESWYNKYRNAALSLYKESVRFSRSELYKLAEGVKDKGDRTELIWAVANTYNMHGGVEDTFQAEFKSWRPSHGERHVENPAVYLIMMLKKLKLANRR